MLSALMRSVFESYKARILETIHVQYRSVRLTMSTHFYQPNEKKFNPSQWVSQAQAAKIRGVTRQAIARLLKNKRFTTLSIGGKTLLKRSEVENFKSKKPGPAPRQKP